MRLVSLASLSLLVLGCASGDGASASASTSGDASDGRYHPPGNGQRVSEQVACETLTRAFDQVICVGTSLVCPELLRRQFGKSCLAYDQGSVAGCVDAFSMKMDCAERKQAFEGCAITPFPDSETGGCP